MTAAFVSASISKASGGLGDYTGTLFDEWVCNRGFVLNTDNTTISTWNGFRKNVLATPSASFPAPANGELSVGNNQGFTLPSSMAVSGDVSLAFVLKSSARNNAEQRLFHAVGTPQLILNLELSAANVNIGMLYNSQTRDFGVSFPYDGQYHVLVFRILSGVGASIYIDGVQAGNTVTFSSSTAIDWTANSTRRFFRTASTGTVGFTGQVRKVRIYKEALSEENISLISDVNNAFYRPVVDGRNIRRIFYIGQSNANGSGILPADLPSYLQGVIPNVFVWDFNFRKFIPLDCNNRPVNFGIGPVFQTAWLFHQKYPDDLIYLNSYCYGGTSLAVDWKVGTGTRYLEWMQFYANTNALLAVEQRTQNVHNTYITWAQGENDAQVQVQANAYQANEAELFNALTSNTGVSDIRVLNLSNRLNLGNFPYRETVRSAKVSNAAAFPNNYFLTPDNATRFPLGVDGVHYTWIGYENYATDIFNKS